MLLLSDQESFVEADPVGDQLRGYVRKLFEILGLPCAAVADPEPAAGEQEVLVLTHRPQMHATRPRLRLLGEFLTPKELSALPADVTVSSVVSLAFELLGTAVHPRFKDVAQFVVKPVLQLKKAAAPAQLPPPPETRRVFDSFEHACLLVCDVQDKVLGGFRPEFDTHALIDGVVRAVEWAKRAQVPVVVTEQVPDKLGATNASLLRAIGPDAAPIAKTRFSAQPEVKDYDHVVVTGIELNICILQTVEDVLRRQPSARVTLLVDCLGSATPEDDWLVYARLRNPRVQFLNSAQLFE